MILLREEASDTHRHKSGETIAADPTLASISALEILVKANHEGGLERLDLASMYSHVACTQMVQVIIEVIVYENDLFHAIEPRPCRFVVGHVKRDTSPYIVLVHGHIKRKGYQILPIRAIAARTVGLADT